MVRTMDSGTRASGAKAPRKGLSAPSVSAGGSGKAAVSSSGGGNPVCPRETPAWQKPITTFFTNGAEKAAEKAAAREPCSELPAAAGESSSLPQPSQRGEESDDGIKHIDKKIRISTEDSDQENKENNAQEEANSDDEKPKKKKIKLNVIEDDSD